MRNTNHLAALVAASVLAVVPIVATAADVELWRLDCGAFPSGNPASVPTLT